MKLVIIAALAMLFIFIYRRYVPVAGIGNMPLHSVSYKQEDIVFVDTRDFQLACRDPIACAHQLPIPYLRRYVHEIPSDKQVVIVASDYEGKNIGARFLKQKGIIVIGYLMRKELRKE